MTKVVRLSPGCVKYLILFFNICLPTDITVKLAKLKTYILKLNRTNCYAPLKILCIKCLHWRKKYVLKTVKKKQRNKSTVIKFQKCLFCKEINFVKSSAKHFTLYVCKRIFICGNVHKCLPQYKTLFNEICKAVFIPFRHNTY